MSLRRVDGELTAAKVLCISRSHYNAMVNHCVRALPGEGCGILGGKSGHVTEVHGLDNVAESNNRYLVDPVQQLSTLQSLDERGLDLAAIFHSHPRGDPSPSALDIQEAYYPDSVYVIVSLRYRAYPAVRAYRINDGRVRRVSLRIEGA